ncbi:MAG: YihY/virulence factor BrkB family protein [Oscillospiraceae bacterium]|nr:YihY/virulence factor BrkB family protein [Oscillospiraceae bacterium]
MTENEIKNLPKNVVARYAKLLAQRYFEDDVGRESASAAYYLLFTIFPLVVFGSYFLKVVRPDVMLVSNYVKDILPEGVIELITSYMNYVSSSHDRAFIIFALVFCFYFPMRATNSLMRSVRRATNVAKPRGFVKHQLKLLFYTIFILISFIGAIVFIALGSHIMNFLAATTMLPPLFFTIWSQFRLVFLALLLFLVLYVLYSYAGDKRTSFKYVAPGAISALVAWMIISILFSFYVTHIAMYSLIYGSIGTLIILLVWLYVSATVIIMGAEFNSVLSELRAAHMAWKIPE